MRKAVEAWARAWSARDLWGYFAAYAPEFKGQAANRAQWEAERIARISGKKTISVRVRDMQLTLSGNSAVVSFKQDYRADAVAMSNDKRLSLVKNKAGDWQITAETSF